MVLIHVRINIAYFSIFYIKYMYINIRILYFTNIVLYKIMTVHIHVNRYVKWTKYHTDTISYNKLGIPC